jgi:hypothetical protein
MYWGDQNHKMLNISGFDTLALVYPVYWGDRNYKMLNISGFDTLELLKKLTLCGSRFIA